jgi:hypothetical protein
MVLDNRKQHVDLLVISVEVIRDAVLQRDGVNRAVVEREKNGAQYRPLRHTIQEQDGSGSNTSDRDRLKTMRKIG